MLHPSEALLSEHAPGRAASVRPSVRGVPPTHNQKLGIILVLPQSVPCGTTSPARTGDALGGHAGTTAVLCMLDLAGDELLKKR